MILPSKGDEGMEAKVIFMDMPPTVKGMTVRMFDDGEYYDTIVLNSRLSHDAQLLAYYHEQMHGEAGDFDSTEMSANEIEYLRHSK